MSEKPKAVVLLSGGMDSSTVAYYAKDAGYDLFLLSIHYGQRHSRELESAAKIAALLGGEHRVIDLSVLRSVVCSSALTSDAAVPQGHYADESMRQTVVPNRNAILLSIAYGYAVTVGASAVFYAAHAGDHAIYPDCRPEFAWAFGVMQTVAVYPPAPVLVVPFIMATKAEIARQGGELGVPFELTWSCYEGRDLHCGKCGTCVERIEAFQLAGIVDPTIYEGESK